MLRFICIALNCRYLLVYITAIYICTILKMYQKVPYAIHIDSASWEIPSKINKHIELRMIYIRETLVHHLPAKRYDVIKCLYVILYKTDRMPIVLWSETEIKM